MSVHQKKINPQGGGVEVELFAGNRHVLSYRCTLMNGDGSNRVRIGEGDTVDNEPDNFHLPNPVSALAGKFIAVSGLISPMVVSGKDQAFSLEIRVRQNGALVGGAPVKITGQLQNTIGILEHVEL
jgi:hypothetical protein